MRAVDFSTSADSRQLYKQRFCCYLLTAAGKRQKSGMFCQQRVAVMRQLLGSILQGFYAQQFQSRFLKVLKCMLTAVASSPHARMLSR
jgi:hypothetical protein